MSRRGGAPFDVAQDQVLLRRRKPIAPRAMAARAAAATSSRGNTSINRRTCTNSRLPCLPHPGFQKTPECYELFRQPPVGQRSCLIEHVDLLFDQRQVVQRIEYEVVALVGSRDDAQSLPRAHEITTLWTYPAEQARRDDRTSSGPSSPLSR